jgi:uncharacterized protein (TIGR03435 family)
MTVIHAARSLSYDRSGGCLGERFALKAHKETREGSTYALVLARQDRRLGPRLTPTQIDCAACFAEKRAAGESVVATGIGDAPPCTGVTSSRFIKASVRSMAVLASMLATRVARPVVDQTRLAGNFDFDLEWSQDLSGPPTPAGVARQEPPLDDGISLFTALQEQLGLKLEPTKGSVEVRVIDHVERPTEN